jgi:hypothetical protein
LSGRYARPTVRLHRLNLPSGDRYRVDDALSIARRTGQVETSSVTLDKLTCVIAERSMPNFLRSSEKAWVTVGKKR